VVRGFLPDLIWNRVSAVGYTGGSFGQCKGGALGVGKVGRFSPGRHSKEPLVAFARLLQAA
jgi:hypothetical protein